MKLVSELTGQFNLNEILRCHSQMPKNKFVQAECVPAYNHNNPSYNLYMNHYIFRGENRVSWMNLNLKYPTGIFQSLFRFKQEDIPALLVALEVRVRLIPQINHPLDSRFTQL